MSAKGAFVMIVPMLKVELTVSTHFLSFSKIRKRMDLNWIVCEAWVADKRRFRAILTMWLAYSQDLPSETLQFSFKAWTEESITK
jgi:hypothetical protein